MSIDETARWSPLTTNDREFVLSQLSVILSSHHFKNSKRYPALLGYLVSKTLNGQKDQLKERTVGVEVFGRAPDYDTNADPVVRVAAAEIRKKIAQFYHENGHESSFQIDLPLGSYVPEFRRLLGSQALGTEASKRAAAAIDNTDEASRVHEGPGGTSEAARTNVSPKSIWAVTRSYALWLVIGLTSVLCLGAYAYDKHSAQSTSDRFWKPLLKSSGSVLTVLPSSIHGPAPSSISDGTEPGSLSHGPYNHISVCDAIALSRFASLLGEHSKSFDIKEADLTSLGDLHGRSVILVGALNNHWTMRLTEPLRFHFSIEPSLVRIVDAQSPQNHDWAVDYTVPYANATHDYAIIARYNDPTTGGNILIIAGIGAHATQAASEFVATPSEIEQLRRAVPAGWENKNLEMIIRTDVINGDSGPPRLVAAVTW